MTMVTDIQWFICLLSLTLGILVLVKGILGDPGIKPSIYLAFSKKNSSKFESYDEEKERDPNDSSQILKTPAQTQKRYRVTK